MRGSPGRRRRLGALTSAGLAIGAQVAAFGAVALPFAAPAAATPGTPGVPQSPVVAFDEDFENGTGQTPILLTAYVGAPPVNAQYTADPPWVSATHCNGIILNQSGANNPACQTRSATAMAELKFMANVLGQVAGSPSPRDNHAVSAYTEGANPGANLVELQTVNPIPLVTSNRFITFSVDAAAVNCNVSAPLLNFFLTGSGPDIPVNTTPINPCTDPRSATYNVGPRPIQAGSFASNSSVLFTGSAVGIKMTNANGSGLGNDHAYDNIRILDVTPQLDKAFAPASIPQGGTSTMTFTVTNTSELAEKDGFSFSDALPAGVTVAAVPNASSTCGSPTLTAVPGSGTVGLSGGDLAAGAASCTFSVDVTSNTPGTYVNVPANVTVAGVNPPGEATLIVNVLGSPTIAKSADAASFQAGETINYAFDVTNTATTQLTNITVTDNGPGTPTVSCPSTTLAAGGSMTCTATYTATATDVANGTIDDTATVTGTINGNTVTGTSNAVSIPLRALSVTKTADHAEFSAAGETITYNFRVTNTGQVPLTDIAVTDNGPGSPVVTCPGNPVAPGDSVNCVATYTTTAADVAAGSITDTGTAVGTAPDGETAQDTSNIVRIPFVPIEADLQMVKTGPAAVLPGGQITYELTVTNNGPDASTGYTVSDTFPAGVSNPTTSAPGCSISSNVLTCTGAALAVGASRNVEVTGTAAAGATTIVNTATVTGQNDDPNPDNNTSSTTTNVTPIEADLGIVKTGPGSVSPGGEITYQLTVTNFGPDDSTGYTVSDNLPAGITGAATSTPGCSISANQLTCTGAALADGASRTIVVTGTAAPGATSIVNTATVTGQDDDPNPDNNTSTTTTNVTPIEADLGIVKTGPASVDPGGQVTYELTVTNHGPDDSTGYTVSDTLPAGLSGATTSTPGCSIGAGVLTCTGSGLADGASTTIEVTGTAAAGATSLVNTARVTGRDDDPNPDNNTSTITTTVTPTPSPVVIKKTQDGPSTVRPGDTVSYTITVTNPGTTSVDASFTDDLSGLLDDANYNNDATATVGDVTFSSPDLEWSGTLAPGQTATITFSVTVHNRPFGDLKLDNTVVSSTPSNCTEGSTDSRCSTHGTVKVKDKDKDKKSKGEKSIEGRPARDV
ncbi:DUF11 domain-containing protein [Streptomyces sp. NPDC047315]|uniref:DUF11 domain-containing protein n=1 Tax=Streptomyces sp. NPDC047315 TaxID=3155142 RepID=UPI0033C97003